MTRRVKTLKKISDQAAIRATRVEFFSKINKRPWSFIRDRRVPAIQECHENALYKSFETSPG